MAIINKAIDPIIVTKHTTTIIQIHQLSQIDILLTLIVIVLVTLKFSSCCEATVKLNLYVPNDESSLMEIIPVAESILIHEGILSNSPAGVNEY